MFPSSGSDGSPLCTLSRVPIMRRSARRAIGYGVDNLSDLEANVLIRPRDVTVLILVAAVDWW